MVPKKYALLSLILVGLISCQSEKPDIYKTKNGNYASKEGGFVASFPKEPHVTVQENKTGNETFHVFNFVTRKRPKNIFQVSYIDYPERILKMWKNKDGDLFNYVLNNQLALHQHLFVMEREPLQNSKYEGVTFKIGSRKDKNYYSRGKMFLKDGRLYYVIFEGADQLPQKKINNFIQSFRTFD